MKWVTRKNANVDRVACPWLIRRFVDQEPEFLYVPPDEVAAVAEREGLQLLAGIVHGADVAADIDIVPEARGLKAIAYGFAYLHGDDDHEKIRLETPMYDALYAWCQAQVAGDR